MSRALVFPVTALLSKFIIQKSYSNQQVIALFVLPFGVILSSAVQYYDEQSAEQYRTTSLGLFFLGVSALLQALEVVLEDRIFLLDKNFTAFGLQGAVALWKVIFGLISIPFAHMIAIPKTFVDGG